MALPTSPVLSQAGKPPHFLPENLPSSIGWALVQRASFGNFTKGDRVLDSPCGHEGLDASTCFLSSLLSGGPRSTFPSGASAWCQEACGL